MSAKRHDPGTPYEVGYGKPPKAARYRKGFSGNPNGRPRRKPDLYRELSRVLHEQVNVTREGEKQLVTVQQALLLRFHDEAMRGEVWAGKLFQKVIEAMPDDVDEYDAIERQVHQVRLTSFLRLIHEGEQRQEGDLAPEPTEAKNDK